MARPPHPSSPVTRRWNGRDETPSLSDPANSETAMITPPIVTALSWSGDRNAPHVVYMGRYRLLAVSSQGTGIAVADFAREALFRSARHRATEWSRPGWRGFSASACADAADLARLPDDSQRRGLADRQMFPATWLERCVAPREVERPRYGYQWYLGYFAFGSPGRRLPLRNAVGAAG